MRSRAAERSPRVGLVLFAIVTGSTATNGAGMPPREFGEKTTMWPKDSSTEKRTSVRLPG